MESGRAIDSGAQALTRATPTSSHTIAYCKLCMQHYCATATVSVLRGRLCDFGVPRYATLVDSSRGDLGSSGVDGFVDDGSGIAVAGARLEATSPPEEHKQTLLDGWGNRAALTCTTAPSSSVPNLFAAQVARTPGAPALTFNGVTLNYRELDGAADRLAQVLVGRGIGRGDVVA
ncbi:AMP-binding protein, partial [Mycobacterium riyadhense]|uniref:AMP-binding protein n=1 Tax=Mycobacterium riyadhense TaxID=486698 RepID=UPI0035569C04